MSDNPLVTPPQQPTGQQPAGTSSGTNVAVIIAIVLGVFLLMALVCGGLLVALLLPAVSAARSAAQSAMASNHMKQIGLGFHNYHAAYRQLPSAFATDASGNPLWSWRVTVLPFVEEQSRWEQWQQDQPWDSAANQPLHLPLPGAYVAPGQEDAGSDETHVFAVRHPRGMMPGETAITFADVSDGLANTVLAVYLPDRTVSWSAPEDVTLAELQAEFATASPDKPVIVLFGDGSVRRFAGPLDPLTVEAIVTRDGGEAVDLAY